MFPIILQIKITYNLWKIKKFFCKLQIFIKKFGGIFNITVVSERKIVTYQRVVINHKNTTEIPNIPSVHE